MNMKITALPVPASAMILAHAARTCAWGSKQQSGPIVLGSFHTCSKTSMPWRPANLILGRQHDGEFGSETELGLRFIYIGSITYLLRWEHILVPADGLNSNTIKISSLS